MLINSKRIERLTLFALIVTVVSAFYYWDFVHKSFQKTHNTLGQMHVHAPTADLFLWSAVAFILYFGTRFWSNIGPHVFALSPERTTVWQTRLRAIRVLSTFIFLGLTFYTIHSNVPDFIDKLPWP